MARRIIYQRRPSSQELAAAAAKQEAHFRESTIILITIGIVSVLLSIGVWYLHSDKIAWWQIPCGAGLFALALIAGTFRLMRWLGM